MTAVSNLHMAVLLFMLAVGLAGLLAFYAVLLAERANTRIDAMRATADDHWRDNRPMFEES
jgi:hypothetical protein